MLVMPARSAFLMPAVPSAWASVPLMPAALGLLDDGADLVDRELAGVRRVRGREHAARRHDLDPVGAGPDLQSRGPAHRVHAVGDPGRQVAHLRLEDGAGRRPAVAVAARLGQRRAAHLGPRPREGPGGEGALDPGRGVAGVADRRHAGLQEVAAGLQGTHHEVRRGALDLIGDRLEAQAQVDVAVDDAGQDGQTGEIDALGVPGNGGGRGGAGGGDPALIVGRHDYPVGDRVGRSAVEQPRTDEDRGPDRRGHRFLRIRMGRAWTARTLAGAAAGMPAGASTRPWSAVAPWASPS